jgi:RNA polymerase sigma-70 factor (ECF subfamily)
MDESIIRQIINGDTEAFSKIIARYKNHCYNLARSILKSDLNAEEAVQEAFINAFLNLRKFRMEAAFSTWLYRIVVNESLKKLKKKDHLLVDYPGETINQEVYSIDPEAIEHMHREDQKELINSVLEQMKPSESLLLKLFYLEEKKIEEIGVITELSEGNIKVILHRGRKSFSVLYNEKITTQSLSHEKR